MKKKLASAGSFVVAFLATASVVLSSVAITLAEALETVKKLTYSEAEKIVEAASDVCP